jgi:endonuclease/exonuclease/phosphatase family metal-dependent hydrolase
MAPERFRTRWFLAWALAVAAGCALSAPAQALRVVNYNITNYPGLNLAGRQPHFRTVLAPLGADVVVVQEMQSQAGVDAFRDGVLNTNQPGEWAAAPFDDGNDTNNALFYRPATVQLLGHWSFYPNPDSALRLVDCYRLKPAGYSGEGAELRIYSQHLKASNGSAERTVRFREAVGIRDSMNAMPPGTHAILLGDFNIYYGAEPAFVHLLQDMADNDGRLYDPLDAPATTWNTAALAPIHTQSPCASCPSGFASGGLDDRFDMFLPTTVMNDGEGLDLLLSTYRPVGNDGLHHNKNITDTPVIPEGAAYATALWNASDHLPIRVDLQLPAKIAVPATLALGSVIVGGGAPLTVSNPAAGVADELTLGFSAPAGFTAPAGPQDVAAGGSAPFSLGTAPGPAGPRAGDLTIASDAPDLPVALVHLTAEVLDHAVPSLDSTALVLADLVDFGQQPAGGFTTRLARVHDLGYGPSLARLSVTGATLTGGDGRFALVTPFQPALVAGVAASYPIAFDDAGATQDSTYEAILTFATADEPLPGATTLADLSVTLRARPAGGTVAVGDPAPATTQLYPPFPNPAQAGTTIRFDLAVASPARVEVFDLAGRRVAALADGTFAPGRYTLRWDGRDASGAGLGAGLYFVRLSVPGVRSDVVRLVMTR